MRTGDVLLVEFDRGPGAAREHEQLYSSALERIRTLPGVEIATTVKTMPFTGFHVPPISVPGLAGPPQVNGQLPFLIAATPQFLDILDVAIVEGRRFVESDERGAPVVIVNETMARSVWPGESALGKCIRIGFEPSFDPSTAAGPPPPPATVPCREVIGVSRDVRQRSVVPTGSEDRLMQYFVPFAQVPPPPAGVGPGPGHSGPVAAHNGGPWSARRADSPRRAGRPDRPAVPSGSPLFRAARAADAAVAPGHGAAVSVRRRGARRAAVGLYATFAHSVAERRREMAIRLAIGARPHRVLVMILREAAGVALAGVCAELSWRPSAVDGCSRCCSGPPRPIRWCSDRRRSSCWPSRRSRRSCRRVTRRARIRPRCCARSSPRAPASADRGCVQSSAWR